VWEGIALYKYNFFPKKKKTWNKPENEPTTNGTLAAAQQ
jgi:hypothetical protein